MIATKKSIYEKLHSLISNRKPLVYKDNKPVALRSLTPAFVEKYNFYFSSPIFLFTYNSSLFHRYVPGRDYDKDQEKARSRALKKRVKQ